MSDDEFTASLQPAVEALDAAKTPCDVIEAVTLSSAMSDPSGPTQTKQVVDYLVLIVEQGGRHLHRPGPGRGDALVCKGRGGVRQERRLRRRGARLQRRGPRHPRVGRPSTPP